MPLSNNDTQLSRVLSVASFIVMLSVIMPNVVMLIVVAPVDEMEVRQNLQKVE
jgi:hypothetical protein